MKTTMKFAVVAAVTLAICSCGAMKRQAVVNVPTGNTSRTGITTVLSQGSQCYEMQEQKPALRSVGSGTNFKESFAKQRANTQALAEYAMKISAAVEAACKEIGVSREQYAGDDNEG